VRIKILLNFNKIFSDDLFSLGYDPGKAIVVGAINS
jgi:hypothetical protein